MIKNNNIWHVVNPRKKNVTTLLVKKWLGGHPKKQLTQK